MSLDFAILLNPGASEGCSGWVDSEVVGESLSLRRVHAWSLVIVVRSVIATIVVVVVLLPLIAHHTFDALEPKQQSCAVLFDTPSWCGGSLTTTPPNVHDVDDEVVVLLGCLSVSVVALSPDDIVVRCHCCLSEGAEELHVDEAEVVSVDCCTDGHEELNQDDVEVVRVDCRTDGFVALTSDDIADR